MRGLYQAQGGGEVNDSYDIVKILKKRRADALGHVYVSAEELDDLLSRIEAAETFGYGAVEMEPKLMDFAEYKAWQKECGK